MVNHQIFLTKNAENLKTTSVGFTIKANKHGNELMIFIHYYSYEFKFIYTFNNLCKSQPFPVRCLEADDNARTLSINQLGITY